MRDAIVLALLVVSFATLVTAHVAISARLTLASRPRYKGLLALLLPPLAPYWAWSSGWRKLTGLWVGALASYALLVIAASV